MDGLNLILESNLAYIYSQTMESYYMYTKALLRFAIFIQKLYSGLLLFCIVLFQTLGGEKLLIINPAHTVQVYNS